jgi:hypothetical protein
MVGASLHFNDADGGGGGGGSIVLAEWMRACAHTPHSSFAFINWSPMVDGGW